MSNATLLVTIRGRVQGVGYRAWLEDQARASGLDGWVRNRRDGTVEALFSGAHEDVAAILAACHDGPRAAIVFDVLTEEYTGPLPERFKVRPTE